MAPGSSAARSITEELTLYSAIASASQSHLAACRAYDWAAAENFSKKAGDLTTRLQESTAAVDLSLRQMYQKRMLIGFILTCEQQIQLRIKGRMDVVNLIANCLKSSHHDDGHNDKETAMHDQNVADDTMCRVIGSIILKHDLIAQIRYAPASESVRQDGHYFVSFHHQGAPVSNISWADMQCGHAPYSVTGDFVIDAEDMAKISHFGWEIIEDHGL